MSYIDWGYYSSHFPKLTEEEFDAALAGAEVKVEIYTHFRSRTATGYKLEQVKAAVANLTILWQIRTAWELDMV